MSFRGEYHSTWDWHPSMEAYPGQFKRLLEEAESEDNTLPYLQFPLKTDYLKSKIQGPLTEDMKRRVLAFESEAYDFKKLHKLKRAGYEMERKLETIRPFEWEMTKVAPFRYSEAQKRLADVRRAILKKKIRQNADRIKNYNRNWLFN